MHQHTYTHAPSDARFTDYREYEMEVTWHARTLALKVSDEASQLGVRSPSAHNLHMHQAELQGVKMGVSFGLHATVQNVRIQGVLRLRVPQPSAQFQDMAASFRSMPSVGFDIESSLAVGSLTLPFQLTIEAALAQRCAIVRVCMLSSQRHLACSQTADLCVHAEPDWRMRLIISIAISPSPLSIVF